MSTENNEIDSANTSSNVIQVSTAKQATFYVNLAKKFLSSNEDVELSGLGSAISIAVTAAEYLRQQGFAGIKSISTSTVSTPTSSEGPKTPKPKIVIVVSRSEKFFDLFNEQQKELEERRGQKASE